MNLLEYFDAHKLQAGLYSCAIYAAGLGVGEINDYHIPPIILEGTQELAYIISISVGSITLFAWAQKRFGKWLLKLFKRD